MNLSKSLYLKAIRCQLYLWRAFNKLEPKPSIADQQKFDAGYEFEECAVKLFKEGISLKDLEFKDNLTKTKELIENKQTIFEAGVQIDNLYIRADILEYNNGWHLYEIKSTSKQKLEHIPDLAFQKYVLEKAGIEIISSKVIHLNKEFIKQGEINPNDLCQITDVTEKVNKININEEDLKIYFKTLESKEEPPITISQKCNTPHPCPFKKQCWGTLPKNNVLQLTNWRQYWKLFQDNRVDLNDLPEDIELNEKEVNIVKAAMTNKPVIEKYKVKEFLDSLNYPLYHFDFETFDTAIPIFDNSRPYQKMPYQYSLHIQPEKGDIQHFEFLSEGGDPRLNLLNQLKKEIGTKGDVIVFNKTFEITQLKNLARDFSEHEAWINNVLERIVDLAVLFENFRVYYPAQKGSYSIKAVLPAITGKGYDNLEINNGADASAMYFYSHIKDTIPKTDKLREDMLTYCGLDTEGMIWIIEELKRLIK